MKRSKLHLAAFSLIEVTVAMGVVVFCLMAMMGLLTVGLASNQTSMSQSGANTIFSAVISDLRATPVTAPLGQSAASLQFQIPIPANPVTTAPAPMTLYFTTDGQSSATIAANSVYRLIVTFLPNGTSSRTATFADLKITWPAVALPQDARGSVETFVALNRN